MVYQICEAVSADKLAKAVNALIAKGWRPVGGMSAVNSVSTANWWFYQAMIHLEGQDDRKDFEEPL